MCLLSIDRKRPRKRFRNGKGHVRSSDEATMGPGGPLGPPAYTIISIYMLLQR